MRQPTVCEPLERRTLCAAVAGLIPVLAADGVLFCTRGTPAGDEVWRTDGTPRGTFRLEAAHGGNPAYNFTPFAAASVAFTIGGDLYMATAARRSAYVVADLDAGYKRTVPATNPFAAVVPVGPRLLVAAPDGLYSVDGSVADTVAVAATAGLTPANDHTSPIVVAGGVGYFLRALGGAGVPTSDDLFRTDGTAAGTSVVAHAVVRGLAGVGDRLVYTTALSAGLAVWSVATTSATALPTLLRTFTNGGIDYGQDLQSIGNSAVFTVSDGIDVDDLWQTDGTAAGTTELGGGFPNGGATTALVVSGPRAYFTTAAHVLWSTDGTPAGTAAVATAVTGGIYPSGDGTAEYLTAADFPAGLPATLWRTGGTTPAVLAQNVTAVSLSLPGGAFVVDQATAKRGVVSTQAWYAGVGTDPGGVVVGPVPTLTPTLTVTSTPTRAAARLTITNAGPATVTGGVRLQVFLSPEPTVTAVQVYTAPVAAAHATTGEIRTATLALHLPPGRQKDVTVRVPAAAATAPAYLVAVVGATGTLPFNGLASITASAPLPGK